MSIRFIGNRKEAIGFGIAGLDAVECGTRADLAAALDEAQLDPVRALVIVSAAVAALGTDIVERVRESSSLPIIIVMPPPAVEAAAGLECVS